MIGVFRGGLHEQPDYYNDTRRGKVLPIRYTSKNTDKSGNHRALRQFDNIEFRQYNEDLDTNRKRQFKDEHMQTYVFSGSCAIEVCDCKGILSNSPDQASFLRAASRELRD